ncbi:phosphonate ABC transporter ATP-binding protein [Elioraea sp.]|uniref:phosphonate ABC transporter ATP-binding protein n=1 Tax=Elioraea sp. TaxID=2185103 RepID=UPI0021DBEF59|nr:ATP-binding cassette domain-containing protein [Elioraea sp.]GIX09752.1 MAG: phosphonates import ATP-binding protein PhnC [Elioraea sp.]
MTAAALAAERRAAAASAPPIAVEVQELRKRFPGGQPVLDGVSFAIGQGQSVALIGANGAGKSTLLRCLVRLVEPDDGAVLLFGRPLRPLGARALRRLRGTVGMVFQRHNLVPRLSVLTNVVHGAIGRSGPGAWAQALAPRAVRAEALACLDRVGLADLADRRADTLSGGQSQRVAIARALMQRPRLLLADEPAASLDPAAGSEVMTLFERLAREDGITLLFTTHAMAHALAHAKRVLGLRAGRIALDEPARPALAARLERFFA